MIYFILAVCVIIFLLYCYGIFTFDEKLTNIDINLNEKVSYPDDVYRYIPEYYWMFGQYPYWYNNVTPFPWYNSTRFYNKYLYYPYIYSYFDPRIRYY